MKGVGRRIHAKKSGCGSIQHRHDVSRQSRSVSNQTLGQNRGKASLPQPQLTMTPEQNHRISIKTQLSRNVEDNTNLSSGNINDEGVSKYKRGRGSYRSVKVDLLTKYGGKIKDKFEIDDDRQESVLRSFVESTMQRLFRAWKTRLHEHYDQYKTDEDRLSHPPKGVNPDDWEYLVQYFGTPEFQALSTRNKWNREKQTTKYCCGSKYFAEVEEETAKFHFKYM